MKNILHRHRLIFYLSWIILALIQARLTELQDDEAYYWVYSKYLSWGYFDHPPMIAILIKMGYTIFPNELGVRFLPLWMNVFSLIIIEKLIDKKNDFLFYAIALSMAAIQLSGFIAVPDIPLIFFTAVFFLCYKRFTGNISLSNALLLGFSIALLLYSKYHAILIVLFTVLSNLKLLTRYQTYIAGFVSLLLFAPHLWWQYQHDWISFRYHLFESNVNAYKISFTGNYILSQLLLPGPLAGFILLPAACLYKTKNHTEKALRYTMMGIYIFFLLSSFRGKVEGNWTSPVFVSLIVLGHQFLNENYSWRRILFKLLPVTMTLVLLARILLIVDVLHVRELKERYHAWKDWPQQMKEKTKGLPIVFSNSYQRASKYWFYSGQMTYSQNSYRERRNNYNFWPIEDSLLGKPVYFLDKYDLWRFGDSIKTPIGWIGYRYDSLLASFAKINFKITPQKVEGLETSGFNIHAETEMPDLYKQFIRTHLITNDTIRIGFFNERGWIKDILTPLSLNQLADKKEFDITIQPHLAPGKYFFLFAINCGYNIPTHNSRKTTLIVK